MPVVPGLVGTPAPATPVPAAYVPLASASDMRATDFYELVRRYDEPVRSRRQSNGTQPAPSAGLGPSLDTHMLRASRAVESRADRRFAPFTTTESHRAEGIDLDDSSLLGGPLDLVGSIAMDRSHALGGGAGSRVVWLQEYAPRLPELWAYTLLGVTLVQPLAGAAAPPLPLTGIIGPEPDTGRLRLSAGLYCPEGTTIRVTYAGGYQTIPEDLNLACLYMAARLAITFADPDEDNANGLKTSTGDLDGQIIELLAPYGR